MKQTISIRSTDTTLQGPTRIKHQSQEKCQYFVSILEMMKLKYTHSSQDCVDVSIKLNKCTYIFLSYYICVYMHTHMYDNSTVLFSHF